MKVCVVGAGAVGTAFALHLASAAHDVTLVARGKRLEQLKSDGGAIRARSPPSGRGGDAPCVVAVAAALDPSTAWDLVLVTVLAHQLDGPLLAALRACPESSTIMFMFNTFRPIAEYRDAVGASRFAFGFPGVLANVEPDGTLIHKFMSAGQRTIVTHEKWRAVFAQARIPTDVERDMQSWLRTHAVFVVALLGVLVPAARRGAGVPWADASRATALMNEGLLLVAKLGSRPTPTYVAMLHRAPSAVPTFLFWLLSRIPSVRRSGALVGTRELIALADAVLAAAPAPGDVRLMREMRDKIQ